MAKFLKINPMSNTTNNSSLVNISDATLIQFVSATVCNIRYGDLKISNKGVISMNGISSGVPVLMDSFEKAIKSNPASLIVELPSNITALAYLGN